MSLESVADFIQGRASVTVGSAHYLAKTQQADVSYAKIVPKLLPLFPFEKS
jgi:intergrase/recombinase